MSLRLGSCALLVFGRWGTGGATCFTCTTGKLVNARGGMWLFIRMARMPPAFSSVSSSSSAMALAVAAISTP